MDGGEPLDGGWQTDVRRTGDVVTRSAKPQSRTVIALLRHLSDHGFDGALRPVGDGFTRDGREQLAYVEGSSPHPGPWPDEDAWCLGDLLRRLHEATASFVPPVDATWQPWFARALSSDRTVIGHGDLGPWNILKRPDGHLALLDWDNAGPVGATGRSRNSSGSTPSSTTRMSPVWPGCPRRRTASGRRRPWSTATGSLAPTAAASATT